MFWKYTVSLAKVSIMGPRQQIFERDGRHLYLYCVSEEKKDIDNKIGKMCEHDKTEKGKGKIENLFQPLLSE